MLEHAISLIEHLSPVWIYFVLFFFSFIENIFPPSPSDVVVVFGASLITAASGEISFLPVLLITSLGSSFGFMLMHRRSSGRNLFQDSALFPTSFRNHLPYFQLLTYVN